MGIGQANLNPALIVALLQLKEVQLLRGAIRAADVESGKQFGAAGIALDPVRGKEEEDRFEPRRVIHPTPRYLPRPVLHPTPRYLPREVVAPLGGANKGEQRGDEGATPKIAPAPPPPWKELPWPKSGLPQCKVKVVVVAPDMNSKGALLDLFI